MKTYSHEKVYSVNDYDSFVKLAIDNGYSPDETNKLISELLPIEDRNTYSFEFNLVSDGRHTIISSRCFKNVNKIPHHELNAHEKLYKIEAYHEYIQYLLENGIKM